MNNKIGVSETKVYRFGEKYSQHFSLLNISKLLLRIKVTQSTYHCSLNICIIFLNLNLPAKWVYFCYQ